MSKERELLQRLVKKSIHLPTQEPDRWHCLICDDNHGIGHAETCPVAEAQALLAETPQSPERLLTQDEVGTLMEAPRYAGREEESAAVRTYYRDLRMENARLKEKASTLSCALMMMDAVGLRVKTCWYSPNVLDANYTAGAISGSATCECWPCRRSRGELSGDVLKPDKPAIPATPPQRGDG